MKQETESFFLIKLITYKILRYITFRHTFRSFNLDFVNFLSCTKIICELGNVCDSLVSSSIFRFGILLQRLRRIAKNEGEQYLWIQRRCYNSPHGW